MSSMSRQTEPTEYRPELGSAFLKECVSYLGEVHGAGAMSGFARSYKESLHVPWFPALKHGMPAYDSRSWSWEFYVDRDGDYNQAISVSADGEVHFLDGDDDGLYLELKLKHPFEMGEVLELMGQISPDNCGKSSFAPQPWSSIVQEIFVLAPGDKQQKLLKFAWAAWAEKSPELLKPFKVFYGNQWEGINEMEYSTWREWLERKASPESLPFAGELKEDDLLFNPSDGFQSPRLALERYDVFKDCEPRLVIRIKPQHSRMYYVDFLQLTEEGQPLFQTLRERPEQLQQLLNQTKVEYPTTRLQEIRLGVELRVARLAYEQEVQSLMRNREPAGKLPERYRLRSKSVKLLHTDYLSQIEAQQNPLPFMIEWPLRRYGRADDPLLRIKYGQQLLNIILKFPLFLALEELSMQNATREVAASIETELFAKPCSEGTLRKALEDLQLRVLEKQIKLPWFGELLRTFVQDGTIRAGRIITARNRFHHAPFDEDGMRMALETELPHLIKLFRNALSGMTFIIPDSLKNEKGQLVVVARPLMGYETDFPRIEFATTAPFADFPNGQVVVLNEKRDRAIPLSQFFKVLPIRTVSVDVGVFDRMVKGHPEFVFIRGIGEEGSA